MADVTPGNETSEFKALKWIGFGATILIAVMAALAGTGVLPSEGLLASIVAGLLAVAHAAKGYAESRGAIKSAQVLSQNPTQPPQP